MTALFAIWLDAELKANRCHGMIEGKPFHYSHVTGALAIRACPYLPWGKLVKLIPRRQRIDGVVAR